MPSPDDAPEGGSGGAVEELTVHATVNGTTVMATYVVEGTAVLLTSADFGEVSAALDGQAPDVVAERLFREAAEAAMARSGPRFMRDDETNVPGA